MQGSGKMTWPDSSEGNATYTGEFCGNQFHVGYFKIKLGKRSYCLVKW